MYLGNAFESMSEHFQWLTMNTALICLSSCCFCGHLFSQCSHVKKFSCEMLSCHVKTFLFAVLHVRVAGFHLGFLFGGKIACKVFDVPYAIFEYHSPMHKKKRVKPEFFC